jgi:hypothetical protein
MNPIIRIAVVMAALAGACLIGRAAWPEVAGNLTALKSWAQTEGEVRSMNGAIEFEIGHEPDSYRAFATVAHTWGLRLFGKAALFVDPADRSHIKPAGLFQMWLSPAGMSVFILLLLATASMARFGSGQSAGETAGTPTRSQWMFTESPGPLRGITLHSPTRQWKIVLVWSILGVALAVLPMLGKGGNPISRIGYITLGSAFALSLWIFAWHTKTLEVSASDGGIRMTSVLGWRDLPWGLIRSVEDQDIFSTYYNGQMRMWELPFPGSTVRVLAFNDERDRTLMTFSPELEPSESLKRLFDLCTERTGLKLRRRTIAIQY